MTLHKAIKFNWKDPDYGAIYEARMENLALLRKEMRIRGSNYFAELKAMYAENTADFITDWGMTYDPRNADIGLPTYIPFVLFPRQREWVEFVERKWKAREPGLTEKSRDGGFTWLAIAWSCSKCIFQTGIAIGFGSRKAEYVDKIGTFKAILPKGRIFMDRLPPEFKGEWRADRDAPLMRITFPATGSIISGEGGDDIGRGDRTSLYMVDESAHLERPDLVDAALSQTTNCRLDISSVKGMNNSFARKRWKGDIEVFIFDWRQDPRKDDAWYAKQCVELDPVVVAQEIDRDYQASVTGVVIPAVWAKACVGAKRALGIAPSGKKGAALDIADEGADKNALALTQGTTVVRTIERSGKGSDTFHTAEWAFQEAEAFGADALEYDSDGIGAAMRGDARIINEIRTAAHRRPIRAVAYRGSEGVFDPDGIVEGTIGREGDDGRTNKDYFLNRKAQGWWEVRKRAQRTYRWVVEGVPCPPDDILDINPDDPDALKLVAELSQATYKQNMTGKMIINKMPPGMKSPNRADAVVIRFAPKDLPPMQITSQLLSAVAQAGIARRRRM